MNQFPPSGDDQKAPYEFGEPQHETIGPFASVMKIAAIIVVLEGAVGVARVLIDRSPILARHEDYVRGGIIAIFVMVLVYCVVQGLWMARAGNSFERIVRMQGDDVSNVMNAVEILRRYFGLIRILILSLGALFLLACIGLVLVIAFR